VYLKRSLAVEPTFAKSLALLGRLEMDRGGLAQAKAPLSTLLQANPESVAARRLMAEWELRSGIATQDQGETAAAEAHYRAGLALDPQQGELNIRLGMIYLVQGRFLDACGPLESFHRQQPDDPQGALYLGQAYAKLGRIADARRILTEGEQTAERTGNSRTAEHCRQILRQL